MSEPSERSDDEAIRQVLYRYCVGVDRCDEELLRSVFHDDAVDDHGTFKLPAAEAVTRILQSTERSLRSQHQLTNVLIEVDGHEARTEAYATCQLVDPGERLRVLGLRYVDRLSKRAGEWRISERRVVHDWSIVLPITDTWDRAPHLPQGSRDRSDPRYEVFG